MIGLLGTTRALADASKAAGAQWHGETRDAKTHHAFNTKALLISCRHAYEGVKSELLLGCGLGAGDPL